MLTHNEGVAAEKAGGDGATPAHGRKGLRYQPDIDGLRAIAVLTVILFHAGFASFSGGFIGVDVFFVISGYLITGIILADAAAGRFTIGNFYERRVRRILPALLVVLAASLVAGIVTFLPEQLATLSASTLAALGFASNIWLWGQAGYFQPDVELFPLLHTWSLSLEEQFYILFPALMIGLARWRVRPLPIVLAGLVVSLLLSAVGAYLKPSATFYLLPTRAWELLLGCALALGAVSEIKSIRLREAIAWTGIVLIILPVFLYSEQTVFPGVAALPPCLGTAGLILVGRDGGSSVTQLLSRPAIVGVGLISYSLYLWHWAIFVFARQLTLRLDLSPPTIAICIALAFALAYLTWRWVELPFRDRRRMRARTVFAATGSGALLIAALAIVAMNGLPGRLSAEARALADSKNARSRLMIACDARAPDAPPCPIGAKAQPSFVIWGDSHAGVLGEALDRIGQDHERAGLLYPFGACPPTLNPTTEAMLRVDRQLCPDRNRHVLDRIVRDPQIRDVILVAYWQRYGDDPDRLLGSLEHTLALLRARGKRVTVIGGLPAPGFNLPWAMAMSSHLGMPLPEADRNHRPSPAFLAAVRRGGGRFVDLSVPLCRGEYCALTIDGRPLFIDSNHLSREAVLTIVVPHLDRAGVLGDPEP